MSKIWRVSCLTNVNMRVHLDSSVGNVPIYRFVGSGGPNIVYCDLFLPTSDPCGEKCQ